ncbi:sensor histidine kinase [Streptomyces aidingensis]|uniref:histidine kinase n=1 Tax=Streptomyces aidingensis TaxID=910347 RepID=A0A1I1SU66_9ACTN|nr:HAMP domain-containing sensor histidine kinase [Streptomyces aidingensis]SFD49892.1 Signal transduction histidine kinase [Streptomyces aidingensis]
MKTRTALGATAVVALALLAAGLLLLAALRGSLGDQVELQAENAARSTAAQLATGTPFDGLELAAGRPVQVVDAEGRVRAVSDGLEAIRGTETDEVIPVPPEQERASGGTAGQTGDGGDDDDGDDGDDDDGYGGDDGDDGDDGGDDAGPGTGSVGDRVRMVDGAARLAGTPGDYRFAVLAATTPAGTRVTVYAGAPRDIERAAVDSVRDSLLTGFPVLLAVVAAVTWLVTWRALRPVEGIRREMAAITRSRDLSRRVPEPGARDEIGRLARTTNETLAALEESVARQRRFVADASHELRSPIASLRTQLEVGRAHPELLDLPGAVRDTVRLQDLAADLLLLARLDAGERPPPDGRADLAALLRRQTARRAGARPGGGSGPAVTVDRLDAVTVPGSAGQLDRVLGNLLDNAERHAAHRVRVSLRRETGHPAAEEAAGAGAAVAVVEVADDGAGVPEPDRERIFERFVRLDEARGRDEGGAGLGLAIARDVARRHGGTLTVATAPEGGALFVLRLPAGPLRAGRAGRAGAHPPGPAPAGSPPAPPAE